MWQVQLQQRADEAEKRKLQAEVANAMVLIEEANAVVRKQTALLKESNHRIQQIESAQGARRVTLSKMVECRWNMYLPLDVAVRVFGFVGAHSRCVMRNI